MIEPQPAAPPHPLDPPPESHAKIILALLAVYLIWGSTYLGMRIALRSFPPFTLGGVRFLVAGTVLYAVTRARGHAAPRRVEWFAAVLVGTFLFGLGNGLTSVALRSVSSGLVAVLFATTPLCSVAFELLWGGRPRRLELVGLGIGVFGVYLLQRNGTFDGSAVGLWAAMAGSASWALGSVWSGRLPRPPGTMAAAIQMIAGGFVMLAIGVASREHSFVVTTEAVLAFGYLTVIGSLVGFTAYQFLLVSTRPAIATSYAFVNPAIALVLGALLADEPLALQHVLACGVTGLAVVCVLRARVRVPPLK